MALIKMLDARTIARIAAGEVIERPASVVKELVENSLDAGASEITVEASGGGIAMVRVADDGCGIPASEVALAFERHATSKITRLEDLNTVLSLGFRGEALPSIAAVADMELLTRPATQVSGTFIRLISGQVKGQGDRGRGPGTTVTVRDLFRLLPARLKFLKGAPAENSHVTNVVSQYALAFPGVRFTLVLDGRRSLQTPGSGRLLDAAVHVYGTTVSRELLEISTDGWDSTGHAITVCGLVGAPSLSRASRSYLSIFVNRRWVTSRSLSYAVEEAYQGLIMPGKHPVAIININLPPSELDVNVHPTKAEIKFAGEHTVFAAVQRAVRQTLMQQMPVPQIEQVMPAYHALPQKATHPPVSLPRWEPPPAGVPLSQPLLTVAAALPLLRVLGQLARTYIVAESGDGLYLIDQHAAHEKIIYELLREQKSQAAVEVQGLLPPVTLELNPRQVPLLASCLARLEEYGFRLEAFGEQTYLVRGVPAVLRDHDWASMMREFLDGLDSEGKLDWENHLLQVLACHGSVRAGQVLSDEEMRALVRQLEQCAQPQTCPHGRPTMVHLTGVQIKREFGRT